MCKLFSLLARARAVFFSLRPFPASSSATSTRTAGPSLQFVLFSQLTEGDVNKIETTFRNQDLKVARCGFQFSVKTRFGTGVLDLLEKTYCVQLEKWDQ